MNDPPIRGRSAFAAIGAPSAAMANNINDRISCAASGDLRAPVSSNATRPVSRIVFASTGRWAANAPSTPAVSFDNCDLLAYGAFGKINFQNRHVEIIRNVTVFVIPEDNPNKLLAEIDFG